MFGGDLSAAQLTRACHEMTSCKHNNHPIQVTLAMLCPAHLDLASAAVASKELRVRLYGE